MNFWRAESLNFICLLQIVKDRSGVNSYDEFIVIMRPDEIVTSLVTPNPDIWVNTSWLKNRYPQGMI